MATDITPLTQTRGLLSNGEFLLKLKDAVQASNDLHRVLRVRIKRYIERDGVSQPAELDPQFKDVSRMAQDASLRDSPAASNKNYKPYKLLVKVFMARSKPHAVRFSTTVEAQDLDQFWKQYVAAMKGGMQGLVKKKKKKKSTKKHA